MVLGSVSDVLLHYNKLINNNTKVDKGRPLSTFVLFIKKKSINSVNGTIFLNLLRKFFGEWSVNKMFCKHF